MNELRKQLIFVRIKLQLTQTELAKATGISQTIIARWETTSKEPQPKSYGKFLAFCEVEGISLPTEIVKK